MKDNKTKIKKKVTPAKKGVTPTKKKNYKIGVRPIKKK